MHAKRSKGGEYDNNLSGVIVMSLLFVAYVRPVSVNVLNLYLTVCRLGGVTPFAPSVCAALINIPAFGTALWLWSLIPQANLASQPGDSLLDHRAGRPRGPFRCALKLVEKTPQADTSTVGQRKSPGADQGCYRYREP